MTRTILLAVLFCLLCSYSANYFSWSGLGTLQGVTFTNANDAVSNGVFGTRTSPSNSNKLMTKAEALANYWVLPDAPYIYSKASNQIVVKRDLVAGDILNGSGTLYYENYTGHTYYGWASTSGACGLSGAESKSVYYKTALAVNTKLYGSTSYQTLGFSNDGNWFNIGGVPVKIAFSDYGDHYYHYVTEVGTCLTPITITITLYYYPNYLEMTATASANVDTNVTINMTINDDLYGTVYPSCVISSGTNSCTSTPSVPTSWGSGAVTVISGTTSPTSSSTQEYVLSY